ncbi:MAG: hypothetical protein AAGJ70_06720 [Pseudomonadota bacterium]
MANPVTSLWHLARAGFVLAQHGVRFFPPGTPVPLPVKVASWLTAPVRYLARATRPRATGGPSEIASGFTALGPSYIKA